MIEGWAAPYDEFPASHGISADQRRCRPGVALVALDVPVGAHEVARIERLAADAGVTRELWSLVAVDAQRVLSEISDAFDIDRRTVVQRLDAAAADDAEDRLGGELSAYARQLRSGAPRPTERVRRSGLALSLSTHMLLSWTRTAAASDQPATAWAAAQLAEAEHAPLRWEAASAADGVSLGEWATVQAARAATRRSSAAQRRP